MSWPGHPHSRLPPRPGSYAQPVPGQNLSGGYNPYANAAFNPAFQYQSYGQSLFRPPQTTPDGYTYSPSYTPAPAYGSTPKRARVDTISAIAESSTGAWRNCSALGCKFVGPGEQVTVHEEDRHLIFAPGRKPQRSEEEERFAKKMGPAPMIEGTSIRLETPEDIEKWIAERKARWPTAKRIAEQAEEKKAAIERGERPEKDGKRGKRGLLGSRADDPAARAEDWGRDPVEREANSGGRGRGRGGKAGRGGRGGHRDLFKTRDSGYQKRDGGSSATVTTATAVAVEEKKAEHPKPALLGIGEYSSSEASGSESGSESSASDSSSDPSSSEAESSESENEQDEQGVVKEDKTAQPPTRPICKFFARTGQCRRGDKCHFAHSALSKTGDAVPSVQTEKKKMPKQPPQKRANPFERPSMLGSLLSVPIQNTLSHLSQTIRFLVANEMLDGVELVPGQAQEEERQRNLVVDIATEQGQAGVAAEPLVGQVPADAGAQRLV